MKFIDGDPTALNYADTIPVVELTRRNLETLLDKLEDEASSRTLVSPGNHVRVRAVENDAHYSDRQPGEVYMPTSGEYR